ncbi:ATP-grasp domain-containing protein [Candidatus Woesearchaeota archaeon]|nr:ATP-grasp domain-containing protein [Candidatus Woesearchaeota archaeon]
MNTLLKNNPKKFEEFARDKYKCYLFLKGFNMPHTELYSKENLKKFLIDKGSTVIKPRFSAKGENVFFIKSIEEIPEICADDFVIQEKIDAKKIEDHVFDVRVLFYENKYYYYSRVSKKDSLLTNLAQGGRAESTEKILEFCFPDEKEKIMSDIFNTSSKIIKALKQRFSLAKAGIDFLIDKTGKIYLLEINSKPGISGMFILRNPDNSAYGKLKLIYGQDFKKKQEIMLENMIGEKQCAE